MPVQAIFKKYPKDIIKKPVMDESNPLYKDVVGKKEKTKEIAVQGKQKTKRWSLFAQIERMAKFSARFPHKENESYPDDENRYLIKVNEKINKGLKKFSDFTRAKEKFAAVVSRSSNSRLKALTFRLFIPQRRQPG